MKTYILWGILLISSLQVQGMESLKDQDIQSVTNAYISTIQQLRQTTDTYMTELRVNGRYYIEWVIDQINEVGRLKYEEEKKLNYYFQKSLKKINDAYANRRNVLAIDDLAIGDLAIGDDENKQLPKKSSTPVAASLRRTNLFEKAESEKAQEIAQLRSKYNNAFEKISVFYEEPYSYLTVRNDTYVYLYFSLQDLKNAIASPLDQNNSATIMAHFQKVIGCLGDLSDTLVDARHDEDTKLAFQPAWLTFRQTIDVGVRHQLFRYTMTPELLTEQMISDFKPLSNNLSRVEEMFLSNPQFNDLGMDITSDGLINNDMT